MTIQQIRRIKAMINQAFDAQNEMAGCHQHVDYARERCERHRTAVLMAFTRLLRTSRETPTGLAHSLVRVMLSHV